VFERKVHAKEKCSLVGFKDELGNFSHHELQSCSYMRAKTKISGRYLINTARKKLPIMWAHNITESIRLLFESM
jgi:hypothetical protein